MMPVCPSCIPFATCLRFVVCAKAGARDGDQLMLQDSERHNVKHCPTQLTVKLLCLVMVKDYTLGPVGSKQDAYAAPGWPQLTPLPCRLHC